MAKIKIPVYQFTKSGEFVKKWESYYSIIKQNPNYDVRHIFLCCKRGRPSAYEYIWTLNQNENLSNRIKRINSIIPKSIVQFSLKGEFITTWKNIKQLINLTEDYNPARIKDCISGRKKSAYGFIWKYEN
jgi:hypothetical protein